MSVPESEERTPEQSSGITNVLLVCAEPPDSDALAGVPIHVAALLEHCPQTCRVTTAHPSGGILWVETHRPKRSRLAALAFEACDPLTPSPSLQEAFEAAVVGTNADVLHVHAPALAPTALRSAARTTSAGLVVTLHDHGIVCERHDLLESGVRYCGIPDDAARCDRCLTRTLGRPPGRLAQWRAQMNDLLAAANAIVAPSDSVKSLTLRVHPEISSRIRRIDWGVPAPAVRCAPCADDAQPLRIGVVGVHATVKGFDRLSPLFEACRDLHVEWHTFGTSDGASRVHANPSSPIVHHGAYHRRDLARLLQGTKIDVVLLPSVGPESFSLAMSEVIAAGLPVIASHLGALGERVERLGAGWLFDPWQPASLRERVGFLLERRGALVEAARHVRELPVHDEETMVRQHAEVWCQVRDEVRAARAEPNLESARTRYRRAALRTDDPSEAWAGLTRAVRHSAAYRDLRLRRVLSDETRRRIQDGFARWMSPKKR